MASKPTKRSRHRQTKPTQRLRTAAEAKAWLEANGISQADFARQLGIPRLAVVDTLRGRGRGLRGASHTAAVALGMKAAPADSARHPHHCAGR